MWTVFVHTLKESIHRRIALALFVVSILVLVAQLGFTHLDRAATGELMVRSGSSASMMPAKAYVTTTAMPFGIGLMANLWILLTLLAVTSLLASYMDKGWVELLLTKGTARWRIFAGRYLGGLAIFGLTALVLSLPVAYFALRAGVPQRAYWMAMLFLLVSFLAGYALIVLASTAQPNVGLLVIVIFLEFIVSGILGAGREQLFKGIEIRWVVWLLKWAYRILPKHSEINGMATLYLAGAHPSTWFPLWTTGVFCAVATAWALWRFERKAF